MSDTITDARALLRLFAQSGYGEIHVRSGDFDLFIARTAGRTNPLRAATTVPAPEARLRTTHVIKAPHIASLISTLPIGSTVAVGEVVARIALLDEQIDIEADQPGMIDATLAEPGALIEYGAPILSLVAV